MKLYIIAVFLLVALTAVLAGPVEKGTPQESHNVEINDVRPLRSRRATCQISGKLGEWVGDSACFAHCLWLGHIRGGYCSAGTCYCRGR